MHSLSRLWLQFQSSTPSGGTAHQMGFTSEQRRAQRKKKGSTYLQLLGAQVSECGLPLPDGHRATTACGRSLHAPSLHFHATHRIMRQTDWMSNPPGSCFGVCFSTRRANKGFTSLVTKLKCTGCNQQFNSRTPARTAGRCQCGSIVH